MSPPSPDQAAQPQPDPVTLALLRDDEILGERARRGPLLQAAWAALGSQRRQVAAVLGGALAVGAVATLLETPRYTATAVIQINDQSPRVLSAAEEPASPGADSDRFLQTQLDLLNSRALAKRVIARVPRLDSPGFHQQMGAVLLPGSTLPTARRERSLDLIDQALAVALPRNSRIATIAFTAPDPALAAEVANAFAEEFIQASLRQRHDSAAYARDFLAGQLREARTRLEQAERTRNAEARAAGLIAPGDTLPAAAAPAAPSLTAASLQQLHAAAGAARAQRIAAEARWNALQGHGPLADRAALENPAVQALLTRQAEVAARLQDELTRHRDGHPGVRQLRAQLDVLDQQLGTTTGAVRAAAQVDLVAARTAEQALTAQVGALRAASLAEQDRAVAVNLLAREVESERAQYDGLLQRFREASAAAGISASNVTIIDRAEPPVKPSSPLWPRNLGFALLAGLALVAALLLRRRAPVAAG